MKPAIRSSLCMAQFTTSGAAAAFKEMIVGIKGTDSTYSVNATKSSADAWSTTTLINGPYPNQATKFNNRNNVLPPSGRTFRFSAFNNARVDAVYSLYQLPIPIANPHTIRARVTNTGGTVLTGLPVTLNVTGANSFTNVQMITIPPQSSSIVSFANFSPTSIGDNALTVTIPADDTTSDNNRSSEQKINLNTYSYFDNSPIAYGLGWGTDAGLFLAKYKITGTDSVAKVRIGLGATGIGNIINAIVMDSTGNIVAQSDPYLTQLGDDWSVKEFAISNSPAFTNSDFYVGLAQSANSSQGYSPLAVQEEDPVRPGAYYYAYGISGGIPTESTTFGRFMIAAVMKGKRDAMVEAVYTLGKLPKPFGTYSHQVSAKIRNKGAADLVDYPVTLEISGANTFTNTQMINLQSLDSAIVQFDPASLWIPGNNTVTVSVPPDDLNSNNSASYFQNVNDSVFSYSDTSAPVGSAGFGTAEGSLEVYYDVPGGNIKVTDVRVHISNNVANIGKTIQAFAKSDVYGSDSVNSNPYVIQATDLDSLRTLKLFTPLNIVADLEHYSRVSFYVGIRQFASAVAYYPVSYQAEGPPSRNYTFFQQPSNGSLSEFKSGRLMIDAVVDTTHDVFLNDPTLLFWDLGGVNSPDSVAATTHHYLLNSPRFLTRGPGAPPSPELGSFATNGFQNDGIATTNSDYFQFQMTPGMSDTMSLSIIYFSAVGDNDFNQYPTGVNSQFAYSLDGVNFTLIHSPTNSFDYYNDGVVILKDIPALQNVTNGTTVILRYYASGSNNTGAWGLNSLEVRGNIWNHKIIADPVVPAGADYNFSDCNSNLGGSISFTSIGNFPPGNIYIAKTNNSIWQDDTLAVEIGTLASNANSGTINFLMPAGVSDHGHNIWIESSLVPTAQTIPSPPFNVQHAIYCPNPTDFFQSKQSGNWDDTATWEISNDSHGPWYPSPLVPDKAANWAEVRDADTVTITTPVSTHWLIVNGKLKLLNHGVNNGSITLFDNFEIAGLRQFKYTINVNGIFQIISSSIYDSVIKISPSYFHTSPKYFKTYGRITIGDGSSISGDGFYSLATKSGMRFSNGGIFEWNSTSVNGPASNVTYFQNVNGHPIFRLTKMPPGNFGGTDSTVINGILEVNTPVTMSGSGKKIFSDGIKGSNTLTQAPGSGEFKTLAAYTEIPPLSGEPGATIGIMDGSPTIILSDAGLTFAEGTTVPDTANIRIKGASISYGKIVVQAGGKMIIDSVLTVQNADLSNEGTIDGTGKIQFTGSDTSILSSPGIINAKIELSNKQLRLDSSATVSSIDLLGGSHLQLGSFHLNMRTGSLVGDSANFIVTNDTGRLSRYVAGTAVPFHIGINETSYTPVTVTNVGTPDNFMVRVGPGVFKDTAITNGNVDRTWFVTDSLEGGSNVTLKMRWRTIDEQNQFDRTSSRISQGTLCPPPINCSGSYFDYSQPALATDVGSGYYALERSGINNFHTNAFIVTSKPFVYTFTGNGNWNDAANWTPGIIPPDIIPAGSEVVISNYSTVMGSECFHTGNITVATGGKLTVLPGKKLRIIPN